MPDGNVTVYRNQNRTFWKYDFNDDGKITTADPLAAATCERGREALDEANVHYAYTDVNGDGKTDEADVDPHHGVLRRGWRSRWTCWPRFGEEPLQP